MPTAFEKLNKILKLEQSQGYHDHSVIGGLANFAKIWRDEALAETSDESEIKRIHEIADLLADYEGIELEQRTQIVDKILNWPEQHDEPAARRMPPPHKPTPSRRPPRTTPTPSRPAEKPPERPSLGLDAEVSSLPGISTTYTKRLKRLGISTVGDMLYHFPHRFDDYSALKPIDRLEYGEETTIVGTVWETRSRKTRGGGTIVTSVIADASGTIEAVWFNQPYLTRQLRSGRRIVLSGKVDEYLGRLTMSAPTWEPLARELIHTARLVPVYPLTRGISARWMRRQMKRVIDHWAPRLKDPLPEEIRAQNELMDLSTAIQQIHYPDTRELAEEARRRLSFDEFLLIQLGMLRQRQEWQSQQGVPLPLNRDCLDGFLNSLPFELTEAQKRSLDQVLTDLTKPRPMGRLLQGDVGSGKTVIAAAAMLMTVAAGRQAALMAPTEILAEQHYQTITEMLADAEEWGLERPISTLLLTGSLRRVERREIYTDLASGEADIVVGTHALIQKHVTFSNLALTIVDEQHRFGVTQRATLREKGSSPHVLVMSATPIPRSLALTIYGDLDISVIDELPPGRQPIETHWLLPRERERAYAFLRSQIERGRQAFVLYPLVEESDKVEARAAVEEYERLQREVFADLELGLLHGRMKGQEKDEVMTRFRDGEIDTLVSTSVIEVGIDVPNATVMLVEGADRFGLAQLHQFRGRVGRGAHKSYCLLISDAASPDDPQTKGTWERLKAIEETQDGFILAQKDLELRGPGDFFGVRQSGLPMLRLASLSNVKILEQARTAAQTIFQDDPTLSQPAHHLLFEQLLNFWQGYGELS
ncbi:MAG: ATP-dependent DNA helicase RecG [Anaerolineae bacterium]|jgi:ATP-dependent DNA helicase RecG